MTKVWFDGVVYVVEFEAGQESVVGVGVGTVDEVGEVDEGNEGVLPRVVLTLVLEAVLVLEVEVEVKATPVLMLELKAETVLLPVLMLVVET